MLYICPCTVPELPPQRLTSSKMIDASARPRPDPPYSSGIIADSHPAWVSAVTNSSGKPLASSRLRQYSPSHSAHRARTPSRMALYSSFRYGFISVPQVRWMSVEMHFGLLGNTVAITSPQLRLAGAGALATHDKVLGRDQGPHAAIGKAPQASLGIGPAERPQAQGGNQRPMHHQPRIAFGCSGVGPVIMDAMTIEGNGGIAEQQGRARCDRLLPIALGQCRAGGEFWRAGLAVDDVLLLADCQLAVLQIIVLDGHEQQRAGAALLLFNLEDGGDACGINSGPQRLVKLDTPAGPHAVAVVRRRQKAAPGRVAIAAEPGFRYCRLAKAPLPQRWQSLAGLRRRLAQGSSDALQQVQAEVVMNFFAASDPGGQC